MRGSSTNRGFSAVELMVAVGIIGILLAIAYPTYTGYMERSRRSEATEALQDLATLQEKFYTDNKEYADDIDALVGTTITENGYYSLDIPSVGTVGGTNQTYTLEATARGPQSRDTQCGTIQLDSSGNKTPDECW